SKYAEEDCLAVESPRRPDKTIERRQRVKQNNVKTEPKMAREYIPVERQNSMIRINDAKTSKVSENARWKRCIPYCRPSKSLRSISRPASESVHAGLLLQALQATAGAL
ncbi:MAG: hypothetical protein WAL75_22800, partial [Terracidiphilus sp.]